MCWKVIINKSKINQLKMYFLNIKVKYKTFHDKGTVGPGIVDVYVPNTFMKLPFREKRLGQLLGKIQH